ncbi:MAG: hypothetical protein SFT68_01005 [Rickettsiaceae bacterium]|nr:hypothetical protein [Rickettsiaceae bacterium]
MKKFFLFLLLIIAATLTAIYLYLDILAKDAIEKYGSKSLGVSVKVSSVSIDLIKGQYKIKGLTIANPNGFTSPNLFEISEVDTKIDYRTLFEDVFHIYFIKIENPKIFYEIGSKGDNVKVLREVSKASSASQTQETKEKRIIIEKFFFNKAEVTTSIQKVGAKSITIPDIYIQNIGKDKNGITVQNASDQILRELTKVISHVNLKGLLDDLINPDKVDNLKSKVEGEVNKFLNGLK